MAHKHPPMLASITDTDLAAIIERARLDVSEEDKGVDEGISFDEFYAVLMRRTIS
jgi:hypothetical protein